jgi:hypothetical protein
MNAVLMPKTNPWTAGPQAKNSTSLKHRNYKGLQLVFFTVSGAGDMGVLSTWMCV